MNVTSLLKMIFRLFIVIAVLGFEPTMDALAENGSAAGTSKDLTLEQAVLAALDNNRDLRIQKLEPVKKGAFERMEKAAFDPEFYAEYAYSREEEPDQNDRFTSEKTQETTLGLGKTFSMGTSVEATVSHERTTDTDGVETQSGRVGLALTQPLLKKFGPSVNLAKVRQASLESKISIYALRGYTQSLVADTENTYWNYVLSLRKIAIFQQSLTLARKQRDEIEQQITIGMLPETDAAAARSEVALREQDLIDAQSQAENHRLALLYLMDPDNLERGVHPVSEPDMATKSIDNVQERISLAETLRPDANEARFRLERDRLDVVATQNGLLPKLDVYLTLGRTAYGDRFNDSFRYDGSHDTGDVTLGLSLTHVLGNHSSKASHHVAAASREQAELALSNLIARIRLDVKLAVNQVERQRKQIKATHVTRLFQEQTCAAEKNRFNVGTSTALGVARAQRDLLAARIAEVEAVVSYRMALIDLYLAQGNLLEIRGITLE